MNTLKKISFETAVLVVGGLIAVAFMLQPLVVSYPEVYFSHTTGNPVKIVDTEGRVTTMNKHIVLPEKYTKVWVQ